MKAAIITSILAIVIPLCADEIEDSVAGVADLSKLKRSSSFLLSKSYFGTLSLKVGKPDINRSKTQKRIYNCFTYDASGFSEPDQPNPKLPAIYHGTSLKGHGTGYGHLAFLDNEMPYVRQKLKDVRTLEKFKRLVPRAIPIFLEPANEKAPEIYWYSWAEIDDENRLTVSYIEVEQDGDRFDLWLWEGECHPKVIKAESGRR